jgi:hypothetical protein
MTPSSAAALNTDADLIQYQRDLVRTQNCFPMGRALKIAIGPSDNWRPAEKDPYVAKYGRLLELRGASLPIAQQAGQMLVMAPLIAGDRVGLPDIPDPDWAPPAWTEEEVTGKVARDRRKDQPAMLTQRLTDRCEMVGGQPAVMEGTDFLIFQPVLSVTFQPELNKQMEPEVWIAEFRPVAGRHCALLVDHKTGESFFFGGAFEIKRPSGE